MFQKVFDNTTTPEIWDFISDIIYEIIDENIKRFVRDSTKTTKVGGQNIFWCRWEGNIFYS